MDVVICNFPPMLPFYMPSAPAFLAGACQWVGLSSTFIDFNIEYQQSNISIDSWADMVLEQNPKLIALSIFSYKSMSYAIELSRKIKEKNPNVCIIAGGSGLNTSGDVHGDIKVCMDQKVINHYIQGDAEYQFPKYLIEQFQLPSIEFFENINPPYLLDYSSYKLDAYKQQAEKHDAPVIVTLTGSKGCVRNCTYCVVPVRWNFVQRAPVEIAKEIRHILSTINDDDIHVHFTDSLVNGSLPAFEELLDLMLDIKKDYPRFNWGGQFIIRRAKQSGDDYWRKIGQSGARLLEIGVETGSDRLRTEMKKYFSNDDLRHSMKLMEKYGVTCVFLMFTGMPTETDQDFNETLSLITELSVYNDTVIKELELGRLTTIIPKTPLHQDSLNNPSMILTPNPIIWYNKNNPELTFAQRINRRKQFEQRAVECGYTLSRSVHQQVRELEDIYDANFALIKTIEKQK